MKIRLGIKLTHKQAEVDKNPARFKILKWGRRTGKTRYQAYWLVKQALLNRDKHWYITRTLALGREEFWPAMMDLLPRDLIAKTDERTLTVRLTNGSTISIKSGEKEDNLRGRGLGSVVLDEAAFLKERLWDQIVRPQLAHSQGPAIIASSPKKGWFTRLFNEAAKGDDANWLASHATIYDNPTVPRDEIEIIKSKTTNATWRQEYMAEELANVGQVYEEFSPRNIYDPSKVFLDWRDYKTVRGHDWGIADDTAAAWIGFSPEGYVVIGSEYAKNGIDSEAHCNTIHSMSAGINIVDDVMDGTAFRRTGANTSVADHYRNHGIVCKRSERDLGASIDLVKRFMRGDGVTPWLYVSSNCNKLITAWQEWEHGDHEPDIAAAARYAIVYGIRRGLTRLADAAPILRAPNNPLSQADADLLLAAKLIVAPIKRRQSWKWNFDSGVPMA